MAIIRKIVSLMSAFIIAFGSIASASTFSGEVPGKYDTEAIQLLQSLGVVTGHVNGDLDLDGFLSRAQAAKMIYVARTGNDDKAYLFDSPGAGQFADVPHGYWAAGYINYCASQGYVTGRGNGSFDPEGKITGFEFMKILLAALGYDAAAEKLAYHPDWMLYTVTAAVEAGLAEGFDGNPGSFITRGQAAELASNMIFAKTVAYNSKKQRIVGNQSFGEKYLSLKVNKGIVAANEETDPFLTGRTRIYVHGNGTGNSGEYLVRTGLEELGQSVTIYTKGDSFTDIYGSANVCADNRILTTYSKLDEGVKTDQGTLRAWLWENGMEISERAPEYITIGIGPGSAVPFYSNAPGERLKAIDNDGDGTVDYLIKIAKRAATVLIVPEDDDEQIVFDTIGGSWSKENIIGVEGVSEGDIVLAYETGGKLYLNKAASVSGKMSRSVPSFGIATIGDAEYAASGLAFADIDRDETAAVTFVQWISDHENFMKERIFYLDDGGNVILIRTPDSEIVAPRYAFVLDSGRSYGNEPFTPQSAMVLLLYTDGNTEALRVNKIGDSPVRNLPREELDKLFDPSTGHADLVVGNVFTYTLNADGTVDLQAAQGQASAPPTIVRNDPNLIAGSIYADGNTVFVRYDGTRRDSRTYTGIQNVPSYTSVSGRIVYEGKAAKAVFITSADDAPINPEYVYIYDFPTETIDEEGNIVYAYPVHKNGEHGTLVADDTNGGLQSGLYSYTVSEWGVFSFRSAEDVSGTVSFTGDGIIAVGTAAYIIDGHTQIYRIKPDGTIKGANSSQLRAGTKVIMALSADAPQTKAEIIYIIP